MLYNIACYVCCCSVAKSCPTLCDPMDRGTQGFPVLRYPWEFAQTPVLWAGDAIQPSYPLSPPSLPALSLSQHQCLSQWFLLHNSCYITSFSKITIFSLPSAVLLAFELSQISPILNKLSLGDHCTFQFPFNKFWKNSGLPWWPSG